MANGALFDSGRSGYGAGALFSPAAAPKPRKKEDEDDGVLGFAGNLLSDVKDAALGIPAGVVKVAAGHGKDLWKAAQGDFSFKNDRDMVETVAKSAWHDWSPLLGYALPGVDGQASKFLRQFYDHPLGPIMDVATIATGGAGAVGRVGAGLSKAGKISETSKLGKLGKGYNMAPEDRSRTMQAEGKPRLAIRHYKANPTQRGIQRVGDMAGTRLASLNPRFNRWTDDKRYDRALKKDEAQRQGAVRASRSLMLAAMVNAGAKLSGVEANKWGTHIEASGRDALETHAHKINGSEMKYDKAGKPEIADGYTFITRTRKFATTDDFDGRMESFAGRHTTSDASLAKRDADGNYLIVPKHAAKLWADEAGQSGRFTKLLYEKPTKAWKWAVLATRPAYFANNAVGNMFMYTMAYGGGGAARGLTDAWRQVHGEKKMAKEMSGLNREMKKLHGDWQDKWYLGLHQGVSQDLMRDLDIKGKRIPKKVEKGVNKLGKGFYPLTHKWTDVFLRRSAINSMLRDHPKVKELMKDGKSFDEAADLVSADPRVRQFVQAQLHRTLGDYNTLNGLEKGLRKVVPFYTWDRAIVQHGAFLAIDKPGRTNALQEFGMIGTEVQEEALGKLPDFLKDIVPLNILGIGGKGNRVPIIRTGSANPYASIPNLAQVFTALAKGDVKGASVGESLSGHMNPLISNAISRLSGQNLMTGVPRKEDGKGFLLGSYADTFQNVPVSVLIDKLLHGNPTPNPNKRTGKTTEFLFDKNKQTDLLALLGLPVKNMSKKRAHEFAKDR